jgi:hypothetical protein
MRRRKRGEEDGILKMQSEMDKRTETGTDL